MFGFLRAISDTSRRAAAAAARLSSFEVSRARAEESSAAAAAAAAAATAASSGILPLPHGTLILMSFRHTRPWGVRLMRMIVARVPRATLLSNSTARSLVSCVAF